MGGMGGMVAAQEPRSAASSSFEVSKVGGGRVCLSLTVEIPVPTSWCSDKHQVRYFCIICIVWVFAFQPRCFYRTTDEVVGGE